MGSDETTTVVTCTRRKSNPGPISVVSSHPMAPEHVLDLIHVECDRLAATTDATDRLVTTTETPVGWVTTCILSRFEGGVQYISLIFASLPRYSREQSEGYVLGQLMISDEAA